MAFAVGSTFDCYTAFEVALNNYEKAVFANFVKQTTVKLIENDRKGISVADVEVFKVQRLYLKCKKSGVPQKRNSVQHVRQTSSYKTKCPSSVHIVFDQAIRKLVVTAINGEHNHQCSPKIFSTMPKQRRLIGEQKKYVEDVLSVKPNVRLVQHEIRKKFGTAATLKDIHNLSAKQKTDRVDTRSPLEKLYGELAHCQGIHAEVIVSGETNELEGIFIQDERMRMYFDLYPEVVIMDATYKLNDRRMPLFMILVIDGNGESQIAAIFILKSENYAIVSQMLAKFKSLNPNHILIKVILADKHFAGRKAYTESFPQAILQICIFHVIQAWKRELKTGPMEINAAQKKDALSIMERMVYAPTEEQYMAAYGELRFPRVKEYFDKNWHLLNIRKQWAAHYTQNFQNYLNRTTNRIESLNQKLKTVITPYAALNTFMRETIQCIESLNAERDHRTICSIQREPIDVVNETETEFKFRNILTNFAYIALRDEKMKSGTVIYTGQTADGTLVLKSSEMASVTHLTMANSCTCAFYKSMSLPCRHIFFFLEKKELDSYVPDVCNRRWLKSRLPAELVGIVPSAILSQNQKYRQVNALTAKITELVAEKSSGLYGTYMEALKKCHDAIQNDQVFHVDLMNGAANEEGKFNKIHLFICGYEKRNWD